MESKRSEESKETAASCVSNRWCLRERLSWDYLPGSGLSHLLTSEKGEEAALSAVTRKTEEEEEVLSAGWSPASTAPVFFKVVSHTSLL